MKVLRAIASRTRSGFQKRSEFSRFAAWAKGQSASILLIVDLDNTLIDTGSHLAKGKPLFEAAAIADEIEGVRRLFSEWRAADGETASVILSARPYSLRQTTLAWLKSHEIPVPPIELVLVPAAEDKVRYWRFAANRFRKTVIIDDLTFGQETGEPKKYGPLTDQAIRIASLYIGFEDIEALKDAPELYHSKLTESRELLKRGTRDPS